MDVVGQWSQRFRKMATVIATVVDNGSYTFDYAALRCDYFPPILEAYAYQNGGWAKYVSDVGALPAVTIYNKFAFVGLGSASFQNRSGETRSFLLMAYL